MNIVEDMSGDRETAWSYTSVPTLSSVLDTGNSYTSGRHASLMASNSTQLREGSLTGQRVNYLDSGYSEEDPDQQVTSCLMKTPSGNIFIPPSSNKPKNDYRYTSSPSPTKDSLKNSSSDRDTLHYGTGVPVLPCRNNMRRPLNGSLSPNGRLHKRIRGYCSWRCTAVFFIILTLALTAALIYITASSFLPISYENAKACAVVVEGDESNRGNELQVSNPKMVGAMKAEKSSILSESLSSDQSRPRNLPPDGTTFKQINVNERYSHSISPYGYLNLQFYRKNDGYVSFELSIPRGSSLGLYARRNALPTHTHYDIMEVVTGFTEDNRRNTRAVKRSIVKKLSFYLVEGHWFVSIYNDDGDEQTVDFINSPSKEMTDGCPLGCNGHGECVLGRCQCEAGFDGMDCSQSVCPMLCSGQGDYINGECVCHPGWKGKECSLRHEECLVPDCSGHGQCKDGSCICMIGYTGEFCEKVDCPDPNCGGHGFCVSGTCICKKGWRGGGCNELDDDARQCLPDCSSHGRFDIDSQKCVCASGWTGEDCSLRVCGLDCGTHGRCEDTKCVCDSGWKGLRCQDKDCDPRCSLHGQCKNGTCLCVTGWNGVHCTLQGCPDECSSHGNCKANLKGEWSCDCEEAWDGKNCGIQLERRCNDGLDNDQDGLLDCQDPECCESRECFESTLCATVSRPIDILLQRQPPAATASFFQKMKFIIEEGSLQRYVKNSAFNESSFWKYFNQSRAAVLRGRVVAPSGRGLVGVRVTHDDLHTEGYTMTQKDGWFDFMVNGGGAVKLKFGKPPFPPQTRTLFAPWNEVIVIEDVVMSLGLKEKNSLQNSILLYPKPQMAASSAFSSTCPSHDYETMKPIVMTSWKLSSQSGSSTQSSLIAESRVLQESLLITNTQVRLIHRSSRARGYLSTIQLQLTPSTSITKSLKQIFLRITIEGVLFEKIFEADPNLKYTYSWQRLNVYRQRVFGTTTAVVKVGYSYIDCDQVIWNTQTTKISGQDLTVSDIGGWDLDIHHRYNPEEGILYRGDGSNVYLKGRPRLIFTVMGSNNRRGVDCSSGCDYTPASKQNLLSPVSIVTGHDGSIFVGDFDYIRRIKPDGTASVLLKLNYTRVEYRYHMAVHPRDGSLYLSDPESYQIIHISNEDNSEWVSVIGSGNRCLPGDRSNCGDYDTAKNARLSYPKGLAISAEGKIYFADGSNIRVVDEKGNISTVIGSHKHRTHWKPLPCEGTISMEDVVLRWPTALAINPLDNTLYFIDDNMVMKITSDGRLQIVAGRPLHCHRPQGEILNNFASHTTLVSPQSITFGPQGEMYVAESDSRRTNRISVVGTDGRINSFAGKDSKCNCLEKTCDCFSEDNHLALETIFGSISSIAAGPDDTLYVADQSNERLRKIQTSIPSMTLAKEYEVYSPTTQELYIFNRFGLHTATKYIPTKETLFKFSYSVSTSNGKLVGITDANGGKITILRDYSGKVNAIENPMRQKLNVRLDRKQMMTSLEYPDSYSVSFSYYRSKELIYSRRDTDGNSFVYEYNSDGRLTTVVTPTGEVLRLSADLNIQGALVNISRGKEVTRVLMQPNSILDKSIGHEKERIKMDSDNSLSIDSKWGHRFSIKTAPYALLNDDNGLAESFPIPYLEKTDIGRDTINKLEWNYFNKGSKMGKSLDVNGRRLLSIEMTKDGTSSQTISVESTASSILNISKGPWGSIKIDPSPSGGFAPLTLETHRLGLPKLWKWGDISIEYEYDHMNRLSKIKHPSSLNGITSYSEYFYPDDKTNEPSKITIPTGGGFLLNRDDHGALKSITTPRGHIHGFSRQHSLGYRRFLYQAPWSREAYESQYDQSGRLIARVYPKESIKIVYAYDEARQLRSILAGTTSVNYHYYAGSALVKSVEVLDEALEYQSKTELKYHLGLLKEIHTRYSGHTAMFDDIYLKYQYDGSGRVSTIFTEIGSSEGNKDEEKLQNFKYDLKIGILLGIGNYRIRHDSFRKVEMTDLNKNFVRIKSYDEHKRLTGISVIIKGYERFIYNAEYDTASQIISETVSLPKNRKEEVKTFVYNFNGQLSKAIGVDSWIYTHDINGNLVSFDENSKKVSMAYDSGDRAVQFGDLEFVSYDERGYIVRRGEQRFTYNGLGQMMMAIEPGRFSVQFVYDDAGRLISKRDHRNNIVQYIYSDPHRVNLVTHVHYPKASRTYLLIYDENNLLVSMETPDITYYIGSDSRGSPIYVFDSSGKLVKEISRSPFGKIQHDSDITLDLHVDFSGGLVDQYTKLVHFGSRVYDPLLGQWMTPNWEKIGQNMHSPFQIFVYRFRNNDPINGDQNLPLMTEITDWLKIFDVDLGKILGSKYAISTIHQPTLAHDTIDDSKSQFSISIGMMRKLEEAIHSLLTPDLLPRSFLTQMNLNLPNFSPRITTKSSSFGEGLLLSDVEGRARVTLVDGVRGDVVQSVFGSILNASSVLDISIAGKEMFYFLKDDDRSFNDDLQELQRLSGSYNVTNEPVRPVGKQICARNSDSLVCLIYGADERQAIRHVLRSARKIAVQRAWIREINRVKSGFIGGVSGTSTWSPAERNEIVSKGEVRGYQSVDIFNVHKYPQLIGQSSNVIFLKEADAQIWRARRRKY
ncbi:teneurin-m isoform X2 [Lepeophtheirus salmonis]|uniref:teneurin-m isoform X2 n=1 Tax=Lepeophtheirus salmonis TaxID=72036 RepID=UPI003AF3B7B3